MMTQAQSPTLLPDEEYERLLCACCKNSLLTFTEAFVRSYRAARVHEFLAGKLEDCFARKVRRLCISMPPRSGKSQLCSVGFPAWALTKSPGLHVIQASYAASLSEGFSLGIRRILQSDSYRRLFPPILSPEINRQRAWATLGGGSFFATGTGGGLVGRGADILICDDLTRDRAEANSQTHRDDVWSWFTSAALTRLSPNGVAIVISARWHEDDLIGRLTSPERRKEFEAAGLQDELFEVVNLEALCEHPETDPLGRQYGEALWPERWPVSQLEARKLQIGATEFAAQYQGRPSPAGGDIFRTGKIRIIDADDVPEDLRTMRGWDLALSTKTQGDYSCGARGGLDKEGNFWLVHMDRGKRAWPDQKRRIIDFANAEASDGRIAVEAVAGFKVAVAELETALRGRMSVRSISVTSDKMTRALPWSAKVDGGMFYIVRGPWNADFLAELGSFPNGTHDDQVDAVSVLWDAVHRQKKLLIA